MRNGRRAGLIVGFALTIVGCSLPAALADTLYVNGTIGNDAWDGRCETSDGAMCGPKATIQAGLDAAAIGDEVIVADGVYTEVGNRDLTFSGKDLTLRSANGPESCIIDCSALGRGFYFGNGETSAAVVGGFTVRYGQPQDDYPAGGAIMCRASSPTIRRCVLTRNQSPVRGGAVYGVDSTLTLEQCAITRNNAPNYGGVGLLRCAATIRDCAISLNDAESGGGLGGMGIHRTTIEDCLISDNTASDFWHEYGTGGGVFIIGDDVIIRRCKVDGNVAAGDFGGIACSGQRVLIVDCDITGNRAGDTTGGVGRYGSGDFTIRNSRMVGNSAMYSGAVSGATAVLNCLIADNVASEGVAIDVTNTLLRNCTIMGNRPGYAIATGDNVTIENCIVWGNKRTCRSPINGAATVAYSAVEAGWPGLGNLDTDPGLCAGGFHLRADSPCRDTGNPTGDYTAETDVDGEPRVAGSVIDMGCDEFTDSDGDALPDWWEIVQFGGPTAGDAAGDQDGDSRQNAAEYVLGTHPWFPYQTYYVDATAGNDAWDGCGPAWDGQHGPKATVQAAVDLADAIEGDVVALAPGAYRGPGNRDIDFFGKLLTLRGNVPGECVLDCQGTGRGVYLNSGESDRATLDGLTIRNGASATQGGGIYVGADASPTIVGCTIENCTASFGSGAWIDGRATLLDCDFRNNAGGRALDLECGTVEDCTFVGNIGGGAGAGAVLFVGCLFAENTANNGGGLAGGDEVRDCVFLNNAATNGGGCSGSGVLFNCSFMDNTASEYGGAVSESDDLLGCTLQGNSATLGGAGWYNLQDARAEATDFLGNTTPGCGGAILIGVDYANLTVVGCRLISNSADNGGALFLGLPQWCSTTANQRVSVGASPRPHQASISANRANELVLENCAIVDNRTTGDAGCTLRISCLPLAIRNCTAARNEASTSGTTGCVGSVVATDSIIRDALAGLWGGYTLETPEITYSNVFGGWTGDGNIDADPLFVDPDGADNDPNTWADNSYRLSAGSPCIDAGSNAAVPVDLLFDLDGLPRITDGNGDGVAIVDMGAYERPATIIGDLNCDGGVDFGDINPFVDVLMGLERYAAKYPGCDHMFADINCDGLVGFGDINPFVDLLMGR